MSAKRPPRRVWVVLDHRGRPTGAFGAEWVAKQYVFSGDTIVIYAPEKRPKRRKRGRK